LWRAADRGDIVLGWLTKVSLVLALLGVVGFDGLSLVQARVSVVDTAEHAAVAARDSWQDTHNVQLAYAEAQSVAAKSGGTVPAQEMVIEPDGTVRLVVHKTARTFVLRHLSKLNTVTNVTGHGRAQPVAS